MCKVCELLKYCPCQRGDWRFSIFLLKILKRKFKIWITLIAQKTQWYIYTENVKNLRPFLLKIFEHLWNSPTPTSILDIEKLATRSHKRLHFHISNKNQIKTYVNICIMFYYHSMNNFLTKKFTLVTGFFLTCTSSLLLFLILMTKLPAKYVIHARRFYSL